MINHEQSDTRLQVLLICTILGGIGFLAMTGYVFWPVVQTATAQPVAQEKIAVPAYDFTALHPVPVQHIGRVKPLHMAATEVVRQITGRAKFQGIDPVAIVVMWMMGDGAQAFDWDKYPFILGQHHLLTKMILALDENGDLADADLSEAELQRKHFSPNELRQLRKTLGALREKDEAKYEQLLAQVEEPLDQAFSRLTRYENIRRKNPLRMQDGSEKDTFYFVALDQVPLAPWFSLRELDEILKSPPTWQKLLRERVKHVPQDYIKPEHREALEKFQQQLQAGTADQALDELAAVLQERRNTRIQQYLDLRKAGKDKEALSHLFEAFDIDALKQLVQALGIDNQAHASEPLIELRQKDPQMVGKELQAIIARRDQALLADMRRQVPAGGKTYNPADPKFRMLHLAFLENRFPKVYEAAVDWQELPSSDATLVLNSCWDWQKAYHTGDADKFAEAGQKFLGTVQQVSVKYGPYPGDETVGDRVRHLVAGQAPGLPSESLLNLELDYNRVQPFMWAWITMLAGVLLFGVSMATDSQKLYWLGLAAYLGSLGLQMYGFFARIIIAGRPPVTNMYETVIWVAFMSGVFALVLELIYRRKVIGLAGAFVATLGLILADQLPVTAAFDPKLDQIQPVLRSNFWLTIHVLTIVSSYAGGTLAWGLGNLTLALMIFGNPRRETIKTLTHYTYRAMQIAVLLLAAGTFLGGWWAAKSWGRFWGWDAKEVGALIALVVYVIPLHMRFIGWVKDFGLAVSAVVCYAAIMMAWYGVNFFWPAGLHAYAFGSGGNKWVFWACLLNLEAVFIASTIYFRRQTQGPQAAAVSRPEPEEV